MGIFRIFKRLISFKVLDEPDLKGIGKDVPVIVVVGAAGVGKTQFIRTLSQAYHSPEMMSSANLVPHTTKIAIVKCEISSEKDKEKGQDIRTRVIMIDTPPQLDDKDPKSTYKEEMDKIKRFFPENPTYLLYLFNSITNRATDFPLHKMDCYILCKGHKSRLFLGSTMWDRSVAKKEERDKRFQSLEELWKKAWGIIGVDPEEGKDENLKTAFKYDNTQTSALKLVEKILNS